MSEAVLRTVRPAPSAAGPRFDVPVPADGYVWWYLDALSDDGQHALTIIAFIGSVFSPYYAWARRRGPASAEDHCALNVALYSPRAARWAMTERGHGGLERGPAHLSIGPSTVAWNGGVLTVRIDEIATPLPRRVRGTVRLHPQVVPAGHFILDAAQRHSWAPLAPVARVEVALEQPTLRWSGAGYFDSNAGAAPLERDFVRWSWSCARLGREAVVLYDAACRDGADTALALHIAADGRITPVAPPPPAALPRTGWRVSRTTRSDGPARIARTLEDSPFYARSVVASRLLGSDVVSVHETLLLDRFRMPVVQALLPFRMPRRKR